MRVGARFGDAKLTLPVLRVELFKSWDGGSCALYALSADECRTLADELTNAAAACDLADEERLREKEERLREQLTELRASIDAVQRRRDELRQEREKREAAK